MHTHIQMHPVIESLSCKHINIQSCCGIEEEQKRILKEEESIASFPGADRGRAWLAPIILRVYECLRERVGKKDKARQVILGLGQN